jgi:hypothetical protein
MYLFIVGLLVKEWEILIQLTALTFGKPGLGAVGDPGFYTAIQLCVVTTGTQGVSQATIRDCQVGGASFQGCAFVTRAADRNGRESPLAPAPRGGDSDFTAIDSIKSGMESADVNHRRNDNKARNCYLARLEAAARGVSELGKKITFAPPHSCSLSVPLQGPRFNHTI